MECQSTKRGKWICHQRSRGMPWLVGWDGHDLLSFSYIVVLRKCKKVVKTESFILKLMLVLEENLYFRDIPLVEGLCEFHIPLRQGGPRNFWLNLTCSVRVFPLIINYRCAICASSLVLSFCVSAIWGLSWTFIYDVTNPNPLVGICYWSTEKNPRNLPYFIGFLWPPTHSPPCWRHIRRPPFPASRQDDDDDGDDAVQSVYTMENTMKERE